MQSKWEGIEEFIAVIDCGSFSSAARSLGISKAHVSQQISRLEDRLGARLLHRTTRKLSLTESGAIYLERCRTILEDLESAERTVALVQQEIRGRIRISTPHLLGEVLLIPALTEFQSLHPNIEIDIDLSSRRVDLIEDCYDLAIQLGVRDDVNVANKELAVTRFHVVASPAYIEKHGQPKSPSELKNHHCLLFADRGQSKPWKFQSDTGTVEVSVNSRWRSNSGHILRAGARCGLGIAYLPDYYLNEDLQNGDLVSIMKDWQSIDRKLVAIYQHKTHLTAKIQFFLDFLSSYFSRHSFFSL